MKHEFHCARSVMLFNTTHAEVHVWLDELSNVLEPGQHVEFDEITPDFPLNPRHRKYRHNRAGIEMVRKTWGDKAAESATVHVQDDLDCSFEDIPIDEVDFVDKGYV